MRVFEGPPGTCPTCKQKTPILLGSLYGEPKATTWSLSADALKAIAEYIAPLWNTDRAETRAVRRRGKKNAEGGTLYEQVTTVRKTVACLCGGQPPKLYWPQINEDTLAGPYCRGCLKTRMNADLGELLENVPIYVVPKELYEALASIAETKTICEDPPAQEPVEELPF